MTVKLKISEFVLTRLRSIKHDVTGGLFGLMYQGNLIILSFNLETESGGLNHKRMQDNFPTEVDLCGLVQIGSSRDAETHLKEILNDIDITDNPILLTSSEDSVKTSLYVHEKLQEIEYEVFSAQDLYREFFFVRARAYLEVVLEPTEKSIKDVLFQLRKKLASGMSSFEFNDSSVILTNGGTFGHDEEEPVSKLIPKKAQGKAKLDFEILDVSLSVKSSPSDEKFSPNAVLFTVNTKPQKLFKLGLSTDVLSMLHINTKLVQLYDILVESNTRVLRLIERHLLVQLKSSQEMREPVIYHFKPEDLGHYFTVIYPEGVSDEDPILTSKRLSLHQHFGLPSLRPVFRRGNAVCFEPSTLLVNPHVGVKGQVLGGQQHLVQGRYSYHHYMQDRFNDDGWGCAYRSLQTLISWFRFQGYSDTAIPTHEEIQKYLHQVGDKPAKFVGSREWIGSMEVAMCLQNFAGVESKIVHVNSGSELAQRGSELAFHFDHQGTPIMIGGGVLAHTILGVDFNPENGEIKFLILDPHYTGADNLETVQSKGWCGWKGANFWDKKSYYNLCMPQRPHVF